MASDIESQKNQPQKGVKGTKKDSAKNTHSGGAIELVTLRNNFYRDNYRKLIIVCLGLIALCGALIYWGMYERTHKPLPQYFATTFDGKLIALLPLSQPNMQSNELLQWARDAAVAGFSYNYVNYRKALQDVRIYFTKNGYGYFLKALQDSNNLQAVQERKMIVSASATGAGVILKQGAELGVYYWIIQIPMLVKYQNERDVINQNIILTMTVARVSNLENPSGVGITTYVVSEGKGQGKGQ